MFDFLNNLLELLSKFMRKKGPSKDEQRALDLEKKAANLNGQP